MTGWKTIFSQPLADFFRWHPSEWGRSTLNLIMYLKIKRKNIFNIAESCPSSCRGNKIMKPCIIWTFFECKKKHILSSLFGSEWEGVFAAVPPTRCERYILSLVSRGWISQFKSQSTWWISQFKWHSTWWISQFKWHSICQPFFHVFGQSKLLYLLIFVWLRSATDHSFPIRCIKISRYV